MRRLSVYLVHSLALILTHASCQTLIFHYFPQQLPKLAVAAWSCLAVSPKALLLVQSTCRFGTGWLETKALMTWHSADIST